MPPELAGLAATQHGLVLGPQVRAAGFAEQDVARLIAAGAWHRVRRGAYVEGTVWNRLDGAARYRLLVIATLLLARRRAVASHWSAAAWLEIDLLGAWPGKVHVTVGLRSGGRSSGLVERHPAPLPPGSAVSVDGFTVTTAARTAVDLARALPFRDGVVVCDSVLRRRLTTLSELQAVVERCAHWEGIPAARRALDFMDGRAESVGESVSRVILHERGCPPPALQTPFHDRMGLIGETDFYWEQFRTIGEFDGKVKYGVLNPRDDPRETLWREKRREDRLRGLAREVVRWTWWDIEHPDDWIARLQAAFRRGLQRP